MERKAYRVLCLGGGAPNLTLMSGALHKLHQEGLHEKSRRPNVISMAGAGAVVGLHYLAPKGMKTKGPFNAEALRNTVNFGISDAIYELLPINYKVFPKSGPSADLFNDFWFSLPQVQEAMNQSGMSDAEALCSDLLLFAGAMICPTDVNFFSQGLCGHPRFIEELIDFKAVQDIDPNDIEIEINAFCIEDQKIVDFTNYERDEAGRPKWTASDRLIPKQITADHLWAALSFPFLHPPHKIGDKHYFEGAAIQCLNDYTSEEIKDVEWAVVLDPLRTNMIGLPNNLWDAYALSIIMPTAGLAELGRSILELKERDAPSTEALAVLAERLKLRPPNQPLSALEAMMAVADPNTKAELYLSEFDIPREKVARAWGWSRSSLKDLFEIGEKGGAVLAEKLRKNYYL